jgi:hypothetical protein
MKHKKEKRKRVKKIKEKKRKRKRKEKKNEKEMKKYLLLRPFSLVAYKACLRGKYESRAYVTTSRLLPYAALPTQGRVSVSASFSRAAVRCSGGGRIKSRP